MRTRAASTLAFGFLLTGGCFGEPPAGTAEGTSSGSAGESSSSSSGDSASSETLATTAADSTGEPVEPISLFDIACTPSNLWFAKPDIEGNAELLLGCNTDGVDGARIGLHDQIVLSDDEQHSNVIGITTPLLPQGGVVGDFEDIDISDFQHPVLRVGLACGEGADVCLVDLAVLTFDPARPGMSLGPGDGLTVNGTSGVSLLELDIQTDGLEEVDSIGIIVFASNAVGLLPGLNNVGYLVDMRIEEK